MCTKWFLRRLGPLFPTSPFTEVSLMEMKKTFQISPLIEVPLYQISDGKSEICIVEYPGLAF